MMEITKVMNQIVNDIRLMINGNAIKLTSLELDVENPGGLTPYIIVRSGIPYKEFYNAIKKCDCANTAVAIKQVIFNPPATIVLWTDGTKTVVKAENEEFDKEKGLAMAICKRTSGNKGNYFEIFKKYCRDEEPNTEAAVINEVAPDPITSAFSELARKAIKAASKLDLSICNRGVKNVEEKD